MKDRVIAFLGGDILVTSVTLVQGSWHQAAVNFGGKLLATLILGIIGGLGGLIAKEIMKYCKRTFPGKK